MGRASADRATLQSAAAANGNGAAMGVLGYTWLGLQVVGTFSATVNPEVSDDGGVTWSALQVTNVTTAAAVTTATAPGGFRALITGLAAVRARVSGYVSGNVTVVAWVEAG
jgi:hypothetical protein